MIYVTRESFKRHMGFDKQNHVTWLLLKGLNCQIIKNNRGIKTKGAEHLETDEDRRWRLSFFHRRTAWICHASAPFTHVLSEAEEAERAALLRGFAGFLRADEWMNPDVAEMVYDALSLLRTRSDVTRSSSARAPVRPAPTPQLRRSIRGRACAC